MEGGIGNNRFSHCSRCVMYVTINAHHATIMLLGEGNGYWDCEGSVIERRLLSLLGDLSRALEILDKACQGNSEIKCFDKFCADLVKHFQTMIAPINSQQVQVAELHSGGSRIWERRFHYLH